MPRRSQGDQRVFHTGQALAQPAHLIAVDATLVFGLQPTVAQSLLEQLLFISSSL